MNVQERQAVRNEQPATPVPVVPETPIPEAPIKTPEPVKQVVSAVTPKTEAPIDYTQAKGREAEIQANLDSFKAK